MAPVFDRIPLTKENIVENIPLAKENFLIMSPFLHSPQKSLATLDGEIVNTEIAVKLEMQDVLKVHDVQT